jgi:hypothetical protein
MCAKEIQQQFDHVSTQPITNNNNTNPSPTTVSVGVKESLQGNAMPLSQVITHLVQAVEPLLTIDVDAFEPWSLVLRHVAATVSDTAEGPRAASEGTADTSLVLDSRWTQGMGCARSIDTSGRCDRLIRSLASHVGRC